MLKPAKKENGDADASRGGKAATPADAHALGISAQGDALRSALLQGLCIALLPVVLALAYLLLLRAPAQQSELLGEVTQRYAAHKAATIREAVDNLRQRVDSAVRSPMVMEAIGDQNPEDITRVEQTLLEFFPEATSLRLLPLGDLGTADLDAGRQGLRNHIEVDLVRRAGVDVISEPEAYQFEGRWLASLAQMAVHPQLPSRRAVLLLTLPGEGLSAWLEEQPMPGEYQLQQRYIGKDGRRDAVVVSSGSGLESAEAFSDIENTPWRVVFRASPALAERLAATAPRDTDIVLLLGLLTLAGLLLGWQRSRAALRDDVERISAAAEHRTPLAVRVPHLLPIAKELRRLTLRRARQDSGNGAGLKAPAAPGGSSTGVGTIEGPTKQPLPPHIFRAYDIRGVADTELDDETVYRIGSAIGTIAGELGEQTLIVGCDGRASSGRIRAVVEKALLQSGRDVIDIGLVPTPLLYFATRHLEAGSGVMITGSHSPAEVNGMKIVLQRQTAAHDLTGKVMNLANTGRFSKGTGHRIQQDVLADYLDNVAGDIAIAVPLKIVVDAGNGATGPVAPTLLEELGCEVISLHCEVDGSFPHHGPDTGNEENLQDLVREVLASKADFGVAFDGDGDRLAVVTGSGRILPTDTLLMLFAKDVVSRNPGADVVYDVKCSRNLAQLVTSLGGRPVLWKTGHALMKEKMLETGALLGGEFSGHIFFGERWFGFDDGMYAASRLAEILSSEEADLDELIAELPQSLGTPEILVPVPEEEKFALIRRFVADAEFESGKRNDLDGLRVDFEQGWGLLRASNTTAALTARFEADDEAQLAQIKRHFREQLARVAPSLEIPF
jgi:phosphomannomutase/phosphoglucomutase